ncbi:VOC family protein [Streptomyces sp. NBC_01795]|uniref:VOC family protein n=1 Tax=unclassified Streptomyces TaxID=2593676 RepID=UPI002DDBE078|nr:MULTISPECIES: VOC family protein [unclassified Streptomyces]WSA90437.1 VOC family protein [Streptomyces sp. NBC_01795]WSB74663.1 VOC family protein [Streptomyces sp. NBC_01775]
MPARFKALALDAKDHQTLADWWCDALGYERREPPAGYTEQPPEWPVPIYDPEGPGPLIWINPVSDAKTVKNRVHMDVFGNTQELLAMGAVLVRARDEEIGWDILQDPEGNEFCVFDPKPRAVRG